MTLGDRSAPPNGRGDFRYGREGDGWGGAGRMVGAEWPAKEPLGKEFGGVPRTSTGSAISSPPARVAGGE